MYLFFVHIASKTTSQQSIYLHFTNGLYLNAFMLVAFAAHVPFLYEQLQKQLCGKHLSTFYERFVYKRFHACCFCGSCTFFVRTALKTTLRQSIYLHFTNGLYINAFMLVAFAAHVPFLYTSPQEQLCGKHKMVEVPSTALGS